MSCGSKKYISPYLWATTPGPYQKSSQYLSGVPEPSIRIYRKSLITNMMTQCHFLILSSENNGKNLLNFSVNQII